MATWRSTARSDPLTLLRAAVAALVLVLVLMVAACGGDEESAGEDPSTQANGTAGATTTSVEDAERAAVEAAYREYWDVVAGLDRHPEAQWRPVMESVAVEPVVTRAVNATRVQRDHGITVYGRVHPKPTVAPIHGANRAKVTDCQDASDAGQADARTGEPRTRGKERLAVVAELVRGRDARWRVSAIAFPEEAC